MTRWLLLSCVMLGCGSTGPSIDAGFIEVKNLTGQHLASCDDPACGNGANPAVGGDHCPQWVPCRAYETVVRRCEYLHNLEHGHAVLAYRCDGECSALKKTVTAFWQSRQNDSRTRRILVTADPGLPKKVAVLVWGFGWQSDTWDEKAALAVLDRQDQNAPEPFLGCDP